MKKTVKFLVKLILGIALFWGLLTFYVQLQGGENLEIVGETSNGSRALVVYDPDPFYNLDQQVCLGFAEGLAEQNWQVSVATVAATEKLEDTSFDLYAFCANTYNWAPDRVVRNYIRDHQALEGKAVVAITLGSGSTRSAQALLEEELNNKNVKLLASRSFWLMRPNDESMMAESNVAVAVAMAREMGKRVGGDVYSYLEDVED